MTGPRLVCAGCGQTTTLDKPVCDTCLQVAGATTTKHCVLCEATLHRGHVIQPAKGGLHMTKTGGYAGRCTA